MAKEMYKEYTTNSNGTKFISTEDLEEVHFQHEFKLNIHEPTTIRFGGDYGISDQKTDIFVQSKNYNLHIEEYSIKNIVIVDDDNNIYRLKNMNQAFALARSILKTYEAGYRISCFDKKGEYHSNALLPKWVEYIFGDKSNW